MHCDSSIGDVMELGEIEAFLTLAEELHFGRTATRLHVSQSRVSQLIRSLERRAGGPLFERTSRRVALTALGEQLRENAAPAYEGLHDALARARETSRTMSGELRVGYLPSLGGAPLTDIADAFRRAHPGCAVTLRQITMTELTRAWSGEVDIQATLLPVDEPGLTVGPALGTYERLLAVADDHPLTAAGRVRLEDLADYHLPAMPPGIPSALHDSYWPTRTPSGRPITRITVNGTYREALHLIARGRIVLPTDSGTTRFRRYPGVTWLPIVDMPAARAVLTWRTAAENARIHAFAGLATRVI
ncbi:LysR family transcriptional regulator [Planomonospora sp. ID67723]|nr:LysR family transcriptional regulator [Planomonospora sp. ID67723]